MDWSVIDFGEVVGSGVGAMLSDSNILEISLLILAVLTGIKLGIIFVNWFYKEAASEDKKVDDLIAETNRLLGK